MQLKLPKLPQPAATLSRWGAELRSKFFVGDEDLVWEDFAPTFTAGFVMTGPVVRHARVCRLGKFAHISVAYTFTTDAAPTAEIFMTLPDTIALVRDYQVIAGGRTDAGGARTPLTAISVNSQSAFSISSGAAFPALTLMTVSLGGTLEVI